MLNLPPTAAEPGFREPHSGAGLGLARGEICPLGRLDGLLREAGFPLRIDRAVQDAVEPYLRDQGRPALFIGRFALRDGLRNVGLGREVVPLQRIAVPVVPWMAGVVGVLVD